MLEFKDITLNDKSFLENKFKRIRIPRFGQLLRRAFYMAAGL